MVEVLAGDVGRSVLQAPDGAVSTTEGMTGWDFWTGDLASCS